MKKKNRSDELSLYLPSPLFKKRFFPPSRIQVDSGDWGKTPLFLSSLEAEEQEEFNLFDFAKKEVI